MTHTLLVIGCVINLIYHIQNIEGFIESNLSVSFHRNRELHQGDQSQMMAGNFNSQEIFSLILKNKP